MSPPLLYSIKTKFVLVSALIVALFSAIWGFGIVREEEDDFLMDLQNSGKVMMTSLKAPIIDTIILGEMGIQPGLLDNFVEEMVGNKDIPVVYAFITDDGGKVLTHSDASEFGKVYSDPITRSTLAGDEFRSATIRRGTRNILDLGLPLKVAGKSWGALRVGLSMARTERLYAQFKMEMLVVSVAFFLAGTTIFYVLGTNMAQPLAQLSRAMQSIDLEALEMEPLPRRSDEIGVLQESFQRMLVRLKRSEQERERALNYLIRNEKMASIGKIVAGVAHEINNPLAAISACTYKVEATIPVQSRSYWETLKVGIERIETIVQQLRDFSRAGNLEMQRVPSDVFFKEAEAFAVMALKEHQVRFQAADCCRPPVLLHIDKGKMHQVVLNLLDNAAALSTGADTVRLCATASDGRYELKVRDNGVGIPAEHQEKIFDIFFTTKPSGVGSGIGLAVCKNIVDLHGGSMGVSSRAGDTTLTVSIPLKTEVGSA